MLNYLKSTAKRRFERCEVAYRPSLVVARHLPSTEFAVDKMKNLFVTACFSQSRLFNHRSASIDSWVNIITELNIDVRIWFVYVAISAISINP